MHRLRIVIHDKKADADKGLAHIAKVAPSVPGLHVEALGSQYAVYSGALSRFEAVVMKSFVSKTVPIKANAVVIEEIDAKTKKKP
ncbi:MAG: hypothetical protein ACU833_13730 [Gammaproteobacteria bacterium]